MTTIAYKNGVIASDSRVTVESEAGGARNFDTKKLFRKTVQIDGKPTDVILATAGESAPGSLFVDAWGTGKSLTEIRELFTYSEADFTILVVSPTGLFEVDKWCVMEPVYEPFYAIGSGAKLAMGAMEAGASAARAVEIACKRDPYTAPPIVTMRLKPHANKPVTALPEMPKPDAQSRNNAGGKDPLAVPRKRRRPHRVLLDYRPDQAGDQPLGRGGPATGVQPATEQGHEAVHRDSGAERDAGT